LPLIRFRDASSDTWTAQIAAYGEKSEDCASLARVIIGVADAPDRIPSPPYPPCTTIKLDVINPPTDYTRYSRDLRAAGADTYAWVLWVQYDPNTEISDPNYLFLRWEFPSDVDGILELRKGGSETGDILVEDMRLTTSYRITAEDGELFTVVWRAEQIPVEEICDGIDNDLDGLIDEEGATGCTGYYRDADNDGYGLEADTRCLCNPEAPHTATVAGDCDDANGDINPGALEVCDGLDNDCDSATVDGSEDSQVGVACDGPDSDLCIEGTNSCVGGSLVCTDTTDDTVEVCDGLDNDCDGLVDEEECECIDYYRDADNDGYGLQGDTRCLYNPEAPYTATQAGDCDDTDPSIYPRPVRVVSAQGYPGQQGVVVPIEIDDALGVAGGDIFLTYDPNMLIAREVRISPLLQDFLTDSYIIEHEGMIILVMANSEGLDAGHGTLAEVIFDVSDDATVNTTVPLTFDTLTIYNENGESLCAIPVNGEFRIVEQGYKGDLNQDKQITAADAILVLKIAVGKLIPSEYQAWAGDVNGDGQINSADAILILKAAVKKEAIFSMSPDHGLPGSIVRVVGWNFGDEQGESEIYFDDIAADPITWTNHEIETAVPPDVQAGPIQVVVINAYGISSNSREFTVDQENRGRMRLSIAAPRLRQGEEPRTISIPIETPAAPCEQVTISIEVDNATGIAGMDIVLGFDSAVLTPVKAECTSLTNGFLIIYANQGNGEFMVSLANHTGIEAGGSSALITVTFEVASGAREADTSGVEVKDIRLYDDNADPIEGTSSENGRIIILGNGACDGNMGYDDYPVSQPPFPSIMLPFNPLNILYTYNPYQMGNWGFMGSQNFGAGLSYQYQGGINGTSIRNLNSGYHWLRALYTYSPYLWTMPQMNFGIAWPLMW